MNRQNRRHRTGFGYIGFGNNHSVLNQSSKKAFSVLKNKLDEETHVHYQLHFSHKKLTKTEREHIKNKIRKAEKKRIQKTIVLFIISAVILAYFISIFVKNLVSRLQTTPSEFLIN